MKNSILEREWQVLEIAPQNERRSKFINYCKKNIELVDMKTLSEQEASYNICGACNKFFNDLMPEFSNLMDLVCEVEIPKYINPANKKQWEEIKNIVQKS